MQYSLKGQQVRTLGDHFIAPNASVIGSVTLGNNVSVWFNSVIRGDNDTITIGDNSQVQDGCVVHADPGFPVNIGCGVSVGHMSMLHGCTLEDNVLIGINSVVLNGARIGKNTLIGANSLIAEGKAIPEGVLVIGSPGRIVRQLTDDEISFLHESAEIYVKKMKRYQIELEPQQKSKSVS